MTETNNQKVKVIVDGDWGGDEMQLTSVLLAHPTRVEILGTTATFGNTDHDQVFENGRNILSFLGAPNIPCYPGARAPSGVEEPPVGDGAHGSDGVGGVQLATSSVKRETKHAVDFIIDTLEANDPGTVTITASGPLTNIAQAFKKNPEAMKRMKQLIIMGGATHDMKGHDTPIRRGNITHFAEFNFQQAPQDAKDVMDSGLPITLLPMNCTHQLTVMPKRQAAIKKAFVHDQEDGEAVLGMMMAPVELERRKFNIDPVMHDINCAFYLLFPHAYEVQKGHVLVDTKNDQTVPFEKNPQGHTKFFQDDDSNLQVGIKINDPDTLFDIYMGSITSCLMPSNFNAPHIVVVGSCNVDLVTYADRFPEAGETLLGDRFEMGYGGKGANQAVSAKNSGGNVSMISCIGDDPFGLGTIKNFEAFGIRTSGIASTDLPTGNAPIFVDTKTGQNRILVNLGANNEISPEVVNAGLSNLHAKPDAIIMQCEMPLETVYHTVQYARSQGITSILNVAPAQHVDFAGLAGLNYLVVNESEASTVSGVPVSDQKTAIQAAQSLLAVSEIGKVIVTLGEKGAVLVSREGTLFAAPYSANVMDTTGAGDAWLGCFGTSIAAGFGEETAMQRANLFAAISTEKPGTQKSYPKAKEFTVKAKVIGVANSPNASSKISTSTLTNQ